MRSNHFLRALGVSIALSRVGLGAPLSTPTVSLELSDCDSIPTPEVRRISAVELKLDVGAEGNSPSDTAVTIHCDGTTAELSLIDRLTRKVVSRSIDLGTTDRLAQPRLLALSVAELISASWAELELSPEPRPRTPHPREDQARAVVEARTRRERPPLVTSMGALVELRAWSRRWVSFGPGLQLDLDFRVSPHWALLVANRLVFEHGTQTDSVGRVDLDLLDGELGALLEGRHKDTRFGFGPGVRGGLLHASGRPLDPNRVAGHSAQNAYVGSMLQLRASQAVGRGLSAAMGLEAGWTVHAVNTRVLGSPNGGAAGTWLAVTLGLGIEI